MSEQTIACRCCVCLEDIIGRIELGDKRIRNDDRKVIAIPFKGFNGLVGPWVHCHCKAVWKVLEDLSALAHDAVPEN